MCAASLLPAAQDPIAGGKEVYPSKNMIDETAGRSDAPFPCSMHRFHV